MAFDKEHDAGEGWLTKRKGNVTALLKLLASIHRALKVTVDVDSSSNISSSHDMYYKMRFIKRLQSCHQSSSAIG